MWKLIKQIKKTFSEKEGKHITDTDHQNVLKN